MSDLDIQSVLGLRYRTSQLAESHTNELRQHLALETKAQVARLAIGRSLNMGPLSDLAVDSKGLDIPAPILFSQESVGAWVGLIVTHSLVVGGPAITSLENLRNAIRLHWHRGVVELWRDFNECEQDYDKFLETLVERRSQMPESASPVSEESGSSDDKPQPAQEQSASLVKALGELGVQVQIRDVLHGPRLTRYRVLLMNLADSTKIDRGLPQIALALNLGLKVPVKTNGDEARTIFIDLPRPRESWTTIPFDKLKDWAARTSHDSNKLLVYVGVSVTGDDVVMDLATAPHLFVGGTTNSGKSVCLHSLIASLLLTHSADTLQLALIDPKRVEFARYSKLANLYRGSIATETPQARDMLQELVVEMDARYASFERVGVANIADARKHGLRLPFIVAVIEELSALVHGDKNIQPLVERLAEKARAAGIHLILATQRPDAETFSGLLRSNIPARIALSVQKGSESKIILDETGAENLLGHGDMFLKLPGELMRRAHGVLLKPEQVMAVLGKRS
jgi:S-DNA-T family DNA segregation ATPase FtsK/SpoIIIE